MPPPGRAWMPGHWRSVQGGYQWVAGFWSLAAQAHVDYLPPPPPPLDTVPSPAPGPGLDYAPGCWVYGGTHYLWRPGFWHPHHPGWIWIPASYAWTPAGYVFVDGYWDHPLQFRGLLFAPVAFDRAMIARGSFGYTPAFVVRPEFLTHALFARPSCRSYYFGDYFGPTYSRAGTFPGSITVWTAITPIRSLSTTESRGAWDGTTPPGAQSASALCRAIERQNTFPVAHPGGTASRRSETCHQQCEREDQVRPGQHANKHDVGHASKPHERRSCGEPAKAGADVNDATRGGTKDDKAVPRLCPGTTAGRGAVVGIGTRDLKSPWLGADRREAARRRRVRGQAQSGPTGRRVRSSCGRQADAAVKVCRPPPR